MLASFAIAALVVIPGCGSDSKGALLNGTRQHATGDAGTGEPDAGDDGAGTCDNLESAASAAFGTFVDQYEARATDTDCTLVTFTEPSYCASPCPVVVNQAGAASAVGVASQDCAQFNALGCSPPLVGCPGFGSPICAAGACALYTLQLTVSGAFVHGTCTALTETYEPSWVKGPAPRDLLALTVTATGGTLSCRRGMHDAALPERGRAPPRVDQHHVRLHPRRSRTVRALNTPRPGSRSPRGALGRRAVTHSRARTRRRELHELVQRPIRALSCADARLARPRRHHRAAHGLPSEPGPLA